MRRLTETLLLLALMLSLAAAAFAWDGDEECDERPIVKTYACADPCTPCPDCNPTLECTPTVGCLPCPPPVECARKKCRRVTDPAGVVWEKCRLTGCRSSVAVPR